MHTPRQPVQSPGRVLAHLDLRVAALVAAYAIFATLWIVFSDQALGLIYADPERLVQWSIYKGIGFVVVTSVLLLLLVRRVFRRVTEDNAIMQAQATELQRLQRLYAALVHVNQAIVRTETRDELCHQICRVLVEHGGFALAWVGWNEPVTHRLTPLAVAGDPAGYINGIQIYTDDRPEGGGPAGQAFRTGELQVSNDLYDDPAVLLWREEIMRRGFRSAAFIPISERQVVAGVLCVYAETPGYFQDREIALLSEAATDVSSALDNLIRDVEHRTAEETARQEKLFSDTMIASMPGVVYFYDVEGRFIRWNRNLEKVTGHTAKELAAVHPLDLVSELDRGLVQTRIQEVFERGEASVEANFLARDGTATPYLFTGRRVEFEGRSCLVGVGIDITERRQAEQELARLAAIVNSSDDAIISETLDAVITTWNQGAVRMFGYTAAETVGQSLGMLFPSGQDDAEREILAKIRPGQSMWLEAARRHKDGHLIEVSITLSPIVDAEGRVIGASKIVRNISARRQAERALQELNATLENRVAERTAELQTALVRAEAADQIKSAFLATMSHELRTPLNSIIGFTGIVLQGLAGPLNPEQSKQLGMVRGSARHLLALINDVLDISKIEAGQLDIRPEPFDLPALIAQVAASMKPQADKKNLTLSVVVAPTLGVMVNDRRRVEQVLLNLLNNAIKFTEHGGVTLTAEQITGFQPSQDVRPGPAACLRLADTGIGIKPENLSKLFKPFYQIESGLTRTHEGTGLGLAICRRLCALMGGEISVASEWKQGSVFTVRLPLQKSSPFPS